ncbi:MAG: hypothetical protein U0744_20535 [Gemmataceae bacterium]
MARRLAALCWLGCVLTLPGCGTSMGLRSLFGEIPDPIAKSCNSGSCGGAIFMPDHAAPIANTP